MKLGIFGCLFIIYIIFITNIENKLNYNINELECNINNLININKNQKKAAEELININKNQQLLIIDLLEQNKIKGVLKATITAYSPRICETDDTPLTTAYMKKVRSDIVAVSRDIIINHGWIPGQKIHIEGVGIKTIGDLMNIRYTNRIDIFFWDVKQAQKFGRKDDVVVTLVKDYHNL